MLAASRLTCIYMVTGNTHDYVLTGFKSALHILSGNEERGSAQQRKKEAYRRDLEKQMQEAKEAKMRYGCDSSLPLCYWWIIWQIQIANLILKKYQMFKRIFKEKFKRELFHMQTKLNSLLSPLYLLEILHLVLAIGKVSFSNIAKLNCLS